jgi:hypothetical protein
MRADRAEAARGVCRRAGHDCRLPAGQIDGNALSDRDVRQRGQRVTAGCLRGGRGTA